MNKITEDCIASLGRALNEVDLLISLSPDREALQQAGTRGRLSLCMPINAQAEEAGQ